MDVEGELEILPMGNESLIKEFMRMRLVSMNGVSVIIDHLIAMSDTIRGMAW